MTLVMDMLNALGGTKPGEWVNDDKDIDEEIGRVARSAWDREALAEGDVGKSPKVVDVEGGGPFGDANESSDSEDAAAQDLQGPTLSDESAVSSAHKHGESDKKSAKAKKKSRTAKGKSAKAKKKSDSGM